jgi:serine/threonine protein kinase
MFTSLDNWLEKGCGTVERPLLPAGAVVDGYRVDGLIGRGGFAEVYRVRHEALGSVAALKILHRTTPAAVERFDREARFLMDHQHPALPRFMGYGTHDGHPYIVMEALEVRDLPSSDREVAAFMARLCACVGYLHSRGVVRRHIKPENILFRADGSPVLADLGLIKRVSDAVPAKAETISIADGRAVAVGTPWFSAPEQFTGDDVSPATDVHALGAVAEVCFGGRPPAAWRPVIRRATSTILQERYRSADDFLRAVRLRHVRRAVPVAMVCLAAAVILVEVAVAVAARRSDSILAPIARELGDLVEIRHDADGAYGYINLGGGMKVVDAPVRLGRRQRLLVEGPGVLSVNLSGGRGSRVAMRNCTVFDMTEDPDPANSPRFTLLEGSYLNFVNLENLDERAFADPYDEKTSVVLFGGPTQNVRSFVDRLNR